MKVGDEFVIGLGVFGKEDQNVVIAGSLLCVFWSCIVAKDEITIILMFIKRQFEQLDPSLFQHLAKKSLHIAIQPLLSKQVPNLLPFQGVNKLLPAKRLDKVFLHLVTDGGKEVVVIEGDGFAETSLPEMNEQVVVDVLGPDYVRAALLFHAVE